MSVRAALNMTYAYLVDGKNDKERRRLNEELHGWTQGNERANHVLNAPIDERGGEG